LLEAASTISTAAPAETFALNEAALKQKEELLACAALAEKEAAAAKAAEAHAKRVAAETAKKEKAAAEAAATLARAEEDLRRNPRIVENQHNIFWGLGKYDVRDIKCCGFKRSTQVTSFQLCVQSAAFGPCVTYPITREEPEAKAEFVDCDVYERPVLYEKAEVFVSWNSSIVKGTITKIIAVKSKLPPGSNYWKYHISKFVDFDEKVSTSFTKSKISKESEGTYVSVMEVTQSSEIFVQFSPGMIVVDTSGRPAATRIGVVLSFPGNVQWIPVTQLVSIGDDGSAVTVDTDFSRASTISVLLSPFLEKIA
jgi:hypothetical protein